MNKARISPKVGKPPVSREIESVKYERLPTITALPLKEETPLIFQIDAYAGNYIDLSLLKLTLGFRILKKADMGTLGKDDPQAIPNGSPLFSLFRNLKVYWNNGVVFNANFIFPWYAQYITQMKMPSSEREVLKYTTGYYRDSTDLQPLLKEGQPTGYGGSLVVADWGERLMKMGQSKYQGIVGPLLHDIQLQEKLLRDDVAIRIR